MIRPATVHDAPAIAAIWNPVIRDTLVTFNSVEKTAADIEAMILERPFFVSDDQGVRGFAHYGPFRGGGGYAHVAEHTIMLGDGAKGKGVGRALMQALETHAKTNGIEAFWAGVSSSNPVGVAFHKALGFQEIALLPDVGKKFGQYLNLHLMQKRL